MSSLSRHLFLTACGLGLAWSTTIGQPARAADSAGSPLQKAEQACLQSAASNGFKAEPGMARSVDGDTVDVPLKLSRAGAATSTITCRYTVSTGLGTLSASQSPTSRKASPFAAAKDETATPAAAGSKKASPYAAAKDEMNLAFGPALARLWLLLVPIGLAAGSYAYLRQRDDRDLAA